MTRLPPMNDYERNVESNVTRFGWHCTSVTPTTTSSSSLPVSYSVVLFQSYKQPEFLIIGQDSESAYAVLSDLANAAKSGSMPPLDRPSDRLVGGMSCAFVPVPEARYNEFVFSALWYYAGASFPLYQAVWPNDEGYYPWNKGGAHGFLKLQPVLALASDT